VVTVDNKSIAAMTSLDDENAQDTLLMVSCMRAQMAARAICSQVRRDGANRMTLKKSMPMIKKARKERNEVSSCAVTGRHLS
jgi:hypothetical protein